MMNFLFGRRLNMMDMITVSFGFIAIQEDAGWLIMLCIMVSGISLSYIGERHLEGSL